MKKKGNFLKKTIAIFLAVLMITSLFPTPVTALATSIEESIRVSVEGRSYQILPLREPYGPPHAFTVLAYTRAAAFTTTSLVITPREVAIGETVTISVLVMNTGDLTGSYGVTLRINNVAVRTENVTLASRVGQRITFNVTKDVAGTYAVDIHGLSGTFIIKAPPINWAPIVGIIVAVVVVGLLALFFLRRRRKAA